MSNPISIKDSVVKRKNHNIKLNDKILVYFNGKKWRAISLENISNALFLHDKFENVKISIIFCPKTSIALMVDKYCSFHHYEDDLMYYTDNYNVYSIIDPPEYSAINRSVFICTLMSALLYFCDIEFVILPERNKPNLEIKTKVSNSKNLILHPNTLVYVLKINNKKIILLGKDSTKTSITGYDLKKSNVIDFLANHNVCPGNTIYVFPIFYWQAVKFFPKEIYKKCYAH